MGEEIGDRCGLERRLLVRADRIREVQGWELTPALLREAADAIGEAIEHLRALVADEELGEAWGAEVRVQTGHCHFCGANLIGPSPMRHFEHCEWLAARKFLDGLE